MFSSTVYLHMCIVYLCLFTPHHSSIDVFLKFSSFFIEIIPITITNDTFYMKKDMLWWCFCILRHQMDYVLFSPSFSHFSEFPIEHIKKYIFDGSRNVFKLNIAWAWWITFFSSSFANCSFSIMDVSIFRILWHCCLGGGEAKNRRKKSRVKRWSFFSIKLSDTPDKTNKPNVPTVAASCKHPQNSDL